ncbi:MAG: flap endonuclease [Gammaproteobacteria bacterium]|nr:MAG: flap endonuclease [Gammaproteobacteria bacterium]
MRLYLVDSSIFIFKAWYARVPEQVNIRQQSNQAFIGFSDFVYRLLTEQAPSKLVFAFDESLKQSQRKSLYPQYKANRSPAPVELKRQFGWCQQWVDLLGIATVSSDRWEADDLIGTLATLHRSSELPIVILTADKDLAQLIHPGDLWWPFFTDRKLDYKAVEKKYGVRPGQIADQLALAGDKVDNIPGIPHIGVKTAANLLRKFGTLENLRRNLTEVGGMKFRYAGRVQQSLIEHESILDISSRLTRINCEVEAMRDIDTGRKAPDKIQLEAMMDDQAMDPLRRQKWQSYLDS